MNRTSPPTSMRSGTSVGPRLETRLDHLGPVGETDWYSAARRGAPCASVLAQRGLAHDLELGRVDPRADAHRVLGRHAGLDGDREVTLQRVTHRRDVRRPTREVDRAQIARLHVEEPERIAAGGDGALD